MECLCYHVVIISFKILVFIFHFYIVNFSLNTLIGQVTVGGTLIKIRLRPFGARAQTVAPNDIIATCLQPTTQDLLCLLSLFLFQFCFRSLKTKKTTIQTNTSFLDSLTFHFHPGPVSPTLPVQGVRSAPETLTCAEQQK